MNNYYEFVVIGAGISACTFASCLNCRHPNSSILLVEHGRRVGGRATTRLSRSYPTLKFDHGLSYISISTDISKDLCKFITPLIKTKTLIDITSEILVISNNSCIEKLVNHQLISEKIYRGFPYMNSICQEIIKQAVQPSKIEFLFKTLIYSIRKKNNLWEIIVDKNTTIKSSNLVISSSLIAHPRCLDIMNIKTLPLHDAFKKGKDEIIKDLLFETSFQKYLKRKNYILYIRKSLYVQNFNYSYLQIWFADDVKDKTKYERIVFQKQLDESIIIVLHCAYIDKSIDKNFRIIIHDMIEIFCKYKKFVDLFLNAELLDIMDWRASQPINNLVPNRLQYSSSSCIGFCGDWFDSKGCSGVEKAMNSSIRLARLFTDT